MTLTAPGHLGPAHRSNPDARAELLPASAVQSPSGTSAWVERRRSERESSKAAIARHSSQRVANRSARRMGT